MKTCKNCKSELEDDALVCPNCGCVVKRNNKTARVKNVHFLSNDEIKSNNEPPKKKRKTWLWVLGWIFIFPIPLTILALRNQKANKVFKVVIIGFAWLIYLLIASPGDSNEGSTAKQSDATETQLYNVAAESENETDDNIKSLSFSSQRDVTVKVGETYTSGSLNVELKNDKDFSPEEDLIFISDNSEVASFAFTRVSYGTTLKYEIIGVDGGETDVYITSKDGSVISEKIHVIVPEPIRVDSIELSGYKTDLVVGEIIEISATITPSDAEDKTLTWMSSDETVVAVDEKGNVTEIGGGIATITALSSNGNAASFE